MQNSIDFTSKAVQALLLSYAMIRCVARDFGEVSTMFLPVMFGPKILPRSP